MNKLSIGIIALTIIVILSSTGCRYSDYLKQKVVQEKAGEICIQSPTGVVCGTPEELKEQAAKQLPEGQPEEKKEIPKEAVKEAVGAIPEKIVIEGDLISFPNLRAIDPDGDKITYKFSKPLNEKGEWQTKEGDTGEYVATIYANDGKSEATQDVKIIVRKFNHPPVLEKIDDFVVEEGKTIVLEPKASDIDGDKLTFSYSGFMGSGEKEATFNDAGTYTVTVTASDGEKYASQNITITVKNVNRAPALEPLSDMAVTEKDLVKITPKAADPDGDQIVYEFSKPLNEKGEWQTKQGDYGDYKITVTASDGEKTDAKTISILVDYLDRPPVFEKIEDITVNEGDLIIIRPLAFDPEKKDIKFTYGGFMNSELYKTTFNDAGTYKETITASDGYNEAKQAITITVNDVNRPPLFAEGSFE